MSSRNKLTWLHLTLFVLTIAAPVEAQRRRRSPRNLRSDATIRAAFRAPVAPASKSVVRVLLDGKPVALGCVVSAAGEILTKASLVAGNKPITLRLPNGSTITATRTAVDKPYDLALLKAPGSSFTPIQFAKNGPPVGSLVAVPSETGAVLGTGIVTLEPRRPRLPVSNGPLRLGVSGRSTESDGVNVTRVVDQSPASDARIRVGDQLVGLDGFKVNKLADIKTVLGKHKHGDEIDFRVLRNGKSKFGTIEFPSPYDHWGGGDYSKRRTGFPTVLFHDVVIKPEQCGGPLVTADGRVVGLNIARALRVASYAIPSSELPRLLNELRPKAN